MDGALAALQIAKIHIAKLLFGASFFPLGIASILFRSVSHYDSNLGLVLAISGCAPAAYLVRGIFRSEKILQQRQDESFFWREFLPYLLIPVVLCFAVDTKPFMFFGKASLGVYAFCIVSQFLLIQTANNCLPDHSDEDLEM